MHAEAQLDRRAGRAHGRSRRRGRARVRLTLAQVLRSLAAALEGTPADRLRQR
jgi:hypothetical protein